MIDPRQRPEDREDLKDYKEKDWQLDAMLDGLLRSYSAAEPRPGFETRLKAVITEQATRARRTSWWMFAASAAALLLFAWIMISNPHKSKTGVADPAVAHVASPAPADSAAKAAIQVTAPSRKRRTHKSAARSGSSKTNQMVLKMVASTEGSKSLVFEHEKLYLTPETPAEAASGETPPAPAENAQAPAVSIRSIGVASIESNAPIEIRDLAPKSSTEKGSL